MDYLTKFPVVVTARAIIVNAKNEVLMVSHHWGKTTWYTPGGRLEEGEILIKGAQREIFEEIGLKIELDKLIYIHDSLRINKDQNLHYFGFYFLARVNELKLDKNWVDQGGEVNFAKFFSHDEIAKNENIHPQFLKNRFWKDLKNGFKDYDMYVLD